MDGGSDLTGIFGDSHRDLSTSYEDYLCHCTLRPLSQEQYINRVNALRRVLGGGEGLGKKAEQTVEALVQDLCLDQGNLWGTGPAESDVYPHPPHLSKMVRMSTDNIPDIGGDGPYWLLGPWAENESQNSPWNEDARRIAVAWCGFSRIREHTRTAYEHWARKKAKPPPEECLPFLGIHRTGLRVWTLKGQDKFHWELEERAFYSQNSSGHTLNVFVDNAGSVAGPPQIGDTVVGRVVHTSKGYVGSLLFVVPGAPEDEQLRRWWREELWAVRIFNRHLRPMDFQRLYAYAFIRRLHEWAWLQKYGVSSLPED